MDEQQIPAEEAPLFAYPAKLTLLRQAGNLNLSALISDISHAGATVRVEAGRVALPEPPEECRLKLGFRGPSGQEIELAARARGFERREGSTAVARVSFENIHLPEVEEILALRASPRKDQRLLWHLWDHLREGGA
jgi:hypothetical protein